MVRFRARRASQTDVETKQREVVGVVLIGVAEDGFAVRLRARSAEDGLCKRFVLLAIPHW